MKKIMFSERYGLEQSVLGRNKTMTRRILKEPKKFKGETEIMLEFHRRLGSDHFYDCVVCNKDGHTLGQLPLTYKIGDEVAIAQTYKLAGWKPDTLQYQEKRKNGKLNGMSDCKKNYHCSGITKIQFFELGLHDAAKDNVELLDADFCKKVYDFILGKADAPRYA